MKINYNKNSLNCSNRATHIIYKGGKIFIYPIFSLTYSLLLGKIHHTIYPKVYNL